MLKNWLKANIKKTFSTLSLLLFCHIALCADVANQVPILLLEEGKIIYKPQYFIGYQPESALDMVLKVPGFVLETAASNRGFSQGTGNLLINDKRPSTKSSDPEDILRRIAASRVHQVEILKEGSSELAGQSGLIVNIVLADDTSLTGSWNANLYDYGQEKLNSAISTSINGQSGDFSYAAELRYFRNMDLMSGPEKVFDQNGNLQLKRDESLHSPSDNHRANISLAWKNDTQHYANLNLSLGYSLWKRKEASTTYDASLLSNTDAYVSQSFYSAKNDWFPTEVSGDYEFFFQDSSLKLLGLFKYDYRKRYNFYTSHDQSPAEYRFNSVIPATRKEGIVRAIYSKPINEADLWQIALEGAHNSLATNPTFEEDKGLGLNQILIQGSNVHVTEDRAEASFLYNRTLSEQLSLQSNLAFEFSRLEVENLPGSQRSYTRGKGFVSLNYGHSQQSTYKIRIEKQVGQLNLLDFTSFSTPSEGTENYGNTNIVPEQKWRFELASDFNFAQGHHLSLSVYKDIIEDLVTYMPIGDGEGIGNLKNSDRIGAKLALSIDSAIVGISGGRFNINTAYNSSTLIDPITSNSRPFNANLRWDYKVDYRQDIENTQWAWEFSVSNTVEDESYRLSQRAHFNQDPASTLAVEHKNVLGMKMKLEIRNLFGRIHRYGRDFYSPNRAGAYSGKEIREREEETVIAVSLSSVF